MKRNPIAIGILVVFTLALIPALVSCQGSETALSYGDIYRAVAVRQPKGSLQVESRGLSVKEAKAVFECLQQAKLRKPEGELTDPIYTVNIALRQDAEDGKHFYEYKLFASEGYQAWELVITTDGNEKVWWLENADGLEQIVKDIIEGDIWVWSAVETKAPNQ